MSAVGGACVGLRCGDGQVADFNSCLCRDAVPPTSIGPSPGMNDQTVPYLQPGFYVNNRFCPASDSATSAIQDDCYVTDVGSGLAGPSGSTSTSTGMAPRWTSNTPVNIFQDVGYVRWDLALDASQYDPGIPALNLKPFLGTWSTFPATLSMSYQLKPNTELTFHPSTGTGLGQVLARDCVENFSGFDLPGASQISLSSQQDCPTDAATTSASIVAPSPPNMRSTASVANLSMNGSSANWNILNFSPTNANPSLKAGVGFGKNDTWNGDISYIGTTTATTAYTSGVFSANSGLATNIGYYKYTWGPVTVKKSGDTTNTDIASGSVSGQIALNVNLGYSPISVVESSASSPDGLRGSVSTRDCSTSAVPHPCVTTGVYRSPGGGVLSQSFSSGYTDGHEASAITSLPTGVTAVSTPKIIEDTSQLDENTGSSGHFNMPARLRTFVKAADGNVYMSRFDGGTWFPWVNLGRPWNCKRSGATSSPCTDLAKPTSIIPPPQRPIYFNDDTAAGYTNGRAGDGLSIASEPVVVAYTRHTGGYYPTTAATTNQTDRTVIGVFVRVSQINNVTGVAGIWHNSVWYTFSVSSTAKLVRGQAWDFDNPNNWTTWMPVDDGSGNFKVQGNPMVIAKEVPATGPGGATNIVTFNVFGTTAFWGNNVDVNPTGPDGTPASGSWTPGTEGGVTSTTGGPLMVHPPVAPRSVTTKNGFPVGVATATGRKFRNWFSYGRMLARTSLNVEPWFTRPEGTTTPLTVVTTGSSFTTSDLGPHKFDPTTAPNFTNLGYNWTAVKFEMSSNRAVTSDWDYAYVDSGVASVPAIRMVANGIWSGHDCDNNTPSLEHGLLAVTMHDVAPCFYEHQMEWQEFDLNWTDPTQGGIIYRCQGIWPGAAFYGTPHPINMNVTNTPQNAYGGNCGYTWLVFGRAVCSDRASCDPVNPSATYLAAQSTSMCGGAPVAPTAAASVFWKQTTTVNTYPDLSGTHTIQGYSVFHPNVAWTWTPPGNLYCDGSGSASLTAGDFLPDRTKAMIQATNITSDVIPVYSHSKWAQGYEAPAYFIYRDATGGIGHGSFESTCTSLPGANCAGGAGGHLSGRRFWSTITKGAFTN